MVLLESLSTQHRRGSTRKRVSVDRPIGEQCGCVDVWTDVEKRVATRLRSLRSSSLLVHCTLYSSVKRGVRRGKDTSDFLLDRSLLAQMFSIYTLTRTR